ncbi:hypothetical protein TNIN_358241 [Trichonephila inaurata madagascariensis]|uniref:Uncharacterized protein n=1 Tax=Trichonephila inaurata madagascariensis TaxID=2747483 RepID=A0A8X6Y339_9ARAC|nr:hypothetical protein TNIN_426721 [Trichonephila inaurata madagascariensis]GFY62054.1 hypothetical protein TNIN_358241 [Trichonephila inaurata madagascariensis]
MRSGRGEQNTWAAATLRNSFYLTSNVCTPVRFVHEVCYRRSKLGTKVNNSHKHVLLKSEIPSIQLPFRFIADHEFCTIHWLFKIPIIVYFRKRISYPNKDMLRVVSRADLIIESYSCFLTVT